MLVDYSKCKLCSCNSGYPAQYVCAFQDTCRGLPLYCEEENCSDQHNHKIQKITTAMQNILNEQWQFGENVSTYKTNFIDRSANYLPLINYYSVSQKELEIQNSPQENQEKKYQYLDQTITITSGLHTNVMKFINKLEDLQSEYKLEEMNQICKEEGSKLRQIYDQISTLGPMDEQLLWNIYEEPILSDYVNPELMSKFSPQNWNTYHGLKIKALKSKLEKQEQGFQEFKMQVFAKLQI
ncbi:UNKNOWN [Stylonychia lemnae]|uniref:Uncharacterized protein n=1 Tax=Stylonychia lemnae TaxID=5949 RepID=A0A078ATP2_STYLE|nr:UNKNOWN [Stylonychia lemnae]|eukprot:CDW85351.1 UNKNOWN [Stylonychia lemnae]